MMKLKLHGRKNTVTTTYFYPSVELLILCLFGFVTLLQLITLMARAISAKNYSPSGEENQPNISVLICAHNEENNLKALIPLLIGQTYQRKEIILILDRCEDGSKELAIQYPEIDILEISETPEHWNAKKYALQKGIEAAKGEWILLTDADCRPEPQWVAEMAKRMSDPTDLVLGISPYEKEGGFLNQLIHYETFLTALEFSSKTIRQKPYMGLGRNMAYKKLAFIQVGGFEGLENTTGGDDDLIVQRIVKDSNVRMALSPNAHVPSIPKKNWKDYFAQKTRHYSVGKHYPAWVKWSEGFRFALHFLFWVLFALSLTAHVGIAMVIWGASFVVRGISINIVAHRLAKRFNHLWLPFVDLVYSVVLPLVSIRSQLIKNVKWK